MTLEEFHKRVDELEVAMMAFPAAAFPIRHEYLPGMYIKTGIFAAHTLVTGEEHTTRHPWVMLRGSMTIATPDGPVTLTGPCRGITEPGTRRVAVVHEETEFSTFHATDLMDPEEIKAAITVKRHHRDGLVQPAPGTVIDGGVAKRAALALFGGAT